MIINRENRAFDYCESFDVAVIGGGISGVIAVAAASKTGARTLLVENSTFLGSVVTMGSLEALMTQYDAQRQVICGLAQEFFDDLVKLDPQAKNTDDAMGYCRSILPYDAEKMKLALEKFLSKYHVTTLFETALEAVQMTADSRISGETLRTRVGAVSVSCRAVVDSTGSGYCAYLAGNDLMVGDDETGQCQPVTVLARFGGVDTAALRQYVREHPKDFKTFRKALNPDVEYLHLWGFSGTLKEGYRTGALDLQRDKIHMMETTVPGEVVASYSRMNIDPFDPFAMSEAQRIGTEQVVQIHDWFRKTIPAFKDSLIRQSGYVM